MQYIYSKTGDEGSIYATRQGTRACNNNNMCNPSLHLFYYGVTHASIVACPHPLSCCIHVYTALVSLLFGTIIPTAFDILMEMFCIHYYHTCDSVIIHGFNENVLLLYTYIQHAICRIP